MFARSVELVLLLLLKMRVLMLLILVLLSEAMVVLRLLVGTEAVVGRVDLVG